MARKAVTPVGLNHVVLNVRNLDESHRFWTEVVGFIKVGQLNPSERRPNPPKMWFYSGDHGGGALSHHDLALMENTALPQFIEGGTNPPSAVGHVAVTLPNREAWLEQLAFMQEKGVKFDRRIEHGMTHSVYIHDPNGYGIEILYELPREVWEDDIEGAQNYAVALPTEGPDALNDSTSVPMFKAKEKVGA